MSKLVGIKDYRRPLFQLEQWSPFLAKKVWGLTSVLENPLTLAFGFSVRHLTDSSVEVEVPLNLVNKSESGQLRSSVLLAAGEFASKLLWQRHLDPQREDLHLDSVHCRFMKPALTEVRIRTELVETERERILRKLRAGEPADSEMPVIFLDSRDQQIASMNCVWQVKPLRPPMLGEGRKP